MPKNIDLYEIEAIFLPDTAPGTSDLSTWPPVLVTDISTQGSGSGSIRECSPGTNVRRSISYGVCVVYLKAKHSIVHWGEAACGDGAMLNAPQW